MPWALEIVEPPIVDDRVIVVAETAEAIAAAPFMAAPEQRPVPTMMTVPIMAPAAVMIAGMMVAVVIIMIAIVIVVVAVMIRMVTIMVAMMIIVIVIVIVIGCHRGVCAHERERSRCTETGKMFHREVP